MEKLLLVDDEIYAIEGLKQNVDWQALGFEEVHEAYNIEMAKRIMEEHGINLLICDIEMPGGNGLQLVGWVKERYPYVTVIFLTCHSEFSYAKRAIGLGVVDYLVKPILFPELAEVVAKAASIRNADREKREMNRELAQYTRLWEVKKPVLVERVWQDYLDGRIPQSPAKLAEELGQVGVELAPGVRILPILIGIEGWNKELTARDEDLLIYAIRNAAQELVIHPLDGLAVQDHTGANLTLLFSDETPGCDWNPEVWKEKCKRFIQSCMQLFYCSVSCYIGGWTKVADLRHAYKDLLLSEAANPTASGRVFLAGDEFPKRDASPDWPKLAEFDALLEQGRVDEAERKLNDALHAVRTSPFLSPAYISMFRHRLQQSAYYSMHVMGMAPGGEQLWSDRLKTYRQLEVWAHGVFGLIVERLRSQSGKNVLVEQVKAYIRDNKERDITREDIAEAVHLNPAYLSRLFRKENGETLTDYILREKMRAASEMLIRTDLPVSQIASSLGYMHDSHFIKMFKRLYRMTPLDYRKNRLKGERG